VTERRERGFTLLEVVVALAILGLAVVAVIQGFAQGLRLLKLSGDHQQAMLLADQKVREVLIPEEQHDQGDEGGFHWERVTRPIETPELTPAGGLGRWRVFEIVVRVSWDESRQVELATLRTVLASATLGPGGSGPGGF
jgi:general secretion pathway protein I